MKTKIKKCGYCGKPLNSRTDFCSDACAGAYEQALRRDTPKIKFFTAGIILGIGILLWGVFSGRSPVTGAGIGLLGATVLLLPFATPETVRLLGYRKSRALGRLLGLLLVAVGLWVGIF